MEPFCRCFVSILFIASSLMQITVRAPASTSNLGPGFDIFGLALSLYSVFTFERSGSAPDFRLSGSFSK